MILLFVFGVTCFWGEIIDEDNIGFKVVQAFISLIILCFSIYWFCHPDTECAKKEEEPKQEISANLSLKLAIKIEEHHKNDTKDGDI